MVGANLRKRAIKKDFFVEIKKTRNKYLSLLLIVALGVAFFSGLQASEPDMKRSADYYYDVSHLMDIQVSGTLGLTTEDVERIKAVDTVKEVEPFYNYDLLCNLEDNRIVLKLISMTKTMNQIEVTSGRLPVEADECLVDENFIQSTKHEVGDTISVYSGTETPIEEILNNNQFTIVGTGTTSYYMSVGRGSSGIGNGKVHSFVIVAEDVFSSEYYSGAYITAENVFDLNCYTQEYEDAVAVTMENIESIADERCQARYDFIVDEGNKEIDSAKEEISEAETALADAANRIETGKQEIEEARQKIADYEQEISDARAAVNEQGQNIENSQAEVNSGWQEINTKETELEAGKEQLEAGKEELLINKTALADSKQQLLISTQGLEEEIKKLEESKELLVTLKAAEEKGDPSVTEQIGELEVAIASVEAMVNQQNEQIEAAQLEIASAEESMAAAETEIASKEIQLAQMENEIEASKKILIDSQAGIDSGMEQLKNAVQLLSAKESELNAAKEELVNAENELLAHEAEYEDTKAEKEPVIADAKQKIVDAQNELADLEMPKWYTVDRQYLSTYIEYKQNAERIGSIGKIFPSVFFLVAILISLTTMTRMVEEERIQIGTLKAIGYSSLSISAKYILYALSASILGGLIGLYIGQMFLPIVVIESYKILYNNFPEIITQLYLEYSLASIFIAVFGTTGAAILACHKVLKEDAVILMRPAVPSTGKRIFLERIGIIWNHLNFSAKAAFRNLIRYKKRFFMTIFGLGGCMALLLVGFGLKDAILSIETLQFNTISTYDSKISISETTGTEERNKLLASIKADETVVDATPVKETSMSISFNEREENATMIVPQNPDDFYAFILLRDRVTHENYELNDTGIMITEKLADLLGVDAGDTVSIKIRDGESVQAVISNITENYFQHYIYISPQLYAKIYGDEPVYNKIFIKNNQRGVAFEDAFGTAYMNVDSVSGIEFTRDISERFATMISSVDAIIYILIISAALLAFIVLYNLNIVNISERIRELSVLKVLGFYDKEVSLYLIRENICLMIIGSAVGMILGKILHHYVILTAEIDIIMFGRNIEFKSYIYSILLTFAFTSVVNLIVHYQLKKIDLVESMKSVE